MPMRVAFDLDGVLADLHKAYAQAAVKLFPEFDRASIDRADVGASPPEQAADFAGRFAGAGRAGGGQPAPVGRDLGAPDGDPEPLGAARRNRGSGVIARLAAVADEKRWDVLFITSRPTSAGATVQRQSQRWLQAEGISVAERLRRTWQSRGRWRTRSRSMWSWTTGRRLSRCGAGIEGGRRAALARAEATVPASASGSASPSRRPCMRASTRSSKRRPQRQDAPSWIACGISSVSEPASPHILRRTRSAGSVLRRGLQPAGNPGVRPEGRGHVRHVSKTQRAASFTRHATKP